MIKCHKCPGGSFTKIAFTVADNNMDTIKEPLLNQECQRRKKVKFCMLVELEKVHKYKEVHGI